MFGMPVLQCVTYECVWLGCITACAIYSSLHEYVWRVCVTVCAIYPSFHCVCLAWLCYFSVTSLNVWLVCITVCTTCLSLHLLWVLVWFCCWLAGFQKNEMGSWFTALLWMDFTRFVSSVFPLTPFLALSFKLYLPYASSLFLLSLVCHRRFDINVFPHVIIIIGTL